MTLTVNSPNDENKYKKNANGDASSSSPSSSASSSPSANSSGSIFDTVDELNSRAQESNEQDKSNIHGMSDSEYLELKQKLEAYGIEYENLSHGNFKNVAKTMAKQIGKEWCYDMIAASYDSVLDLVLDEKLNNALIACGVKGDWNWEKIVNNGSLCKKLQEQYGIVINKTSSRNYWVSLVDENGNVIKDKNGKLAQIKKTDCMLPDGAAQDVEKFASAAIDAMGYDCVSITDLTPEEYAMVKKLASLDVKNSELGEASDIKDAVGARYNRANNAEAKSKSLDAWKNAKANGYFSGFGTGDAYALNGVDGGILQPDFNNEVEEYMDMGYTKDEAVRRVNNDNNTNMEYTGAKKDKTGEKQEEKEYELNKANENDKKVNYKDLTNYDYDTYVTDLATQGYSLEKAIEKANSDLGVTSFEYNGIYKNKLKKHQEKLTRV